LLTRRIVGFSSFIYMVSVCSYASTNETLGDIGRFLIPLSSASATLLLHDYQGLEQLALATGLVQGTTEGLKLATNEQRPNGECCSSFPSGHASLAFTGASFIHFRYGLKYSIPLYLGSFYVAYSRVNIQAHYVHDVAFGAALAVTGTYLSTTKYKGSNFSVVADGKYAGIIYRRLFD
jgi:hypothetical protein